LAEYYPVVAKFWY